MIPATTEILVIGAGVIGTSTTYYLARAGHQVTLVDRSDVAGGTSSACDGFIIQQSKSPGIHLQLAMESVRLYRTLPAELDYDIEYRPEGCMMLYETPEEAESMRHTVEKQRRLGLDVQVLDRKETLALQPSLSPHILGSTYCAEDGLVSPMALALGYAHAAKRLGAKIIPGAQVLAIRPQGKGFLVTTKQGTISAGVVVNAAGAYGREIAAMVGVEVPIVPRRGQVAVTEPIPPLVRGGVLHANYLGVKYRSSEATTNQSLAAQLGLTFGVEQTNRGNLLINNTREFAGFDRRTTREGIGVVLQNAIRMMPVLKHLRVIRTFSGLRPYTPDGLPVLGKVDAVPNFVMAAGHEGDGICLSPITGRLVSEFVTTGITPPLIAPFSLNRFAANVAKQA